MFASGKDEAHLETGCRYLKEYAKRKYAKADPSSPVEIIGPASPGIGKISNVYRKVLYLKTERYDTLVKIKEPTGTIYRSKFRFNTIRIEFDFNPMNVF